MVGPKGHQIRDQKVVQKASNGYVLPVQSTAAHKRKNSNWSASQLSRSRRGVMQDGTEEEWSLQGANGRPGLSSYEGEGNLTLEEGGKGVWERWMRKRKDFGQFGKWFYFSIMRTCFVFGGLE